MTAVDIVLIVGGIIIIIISYLIGENVAKDSAGDYGKELWTDKEENLIRDRISYILTDKSEDIISETDDRLCTLSNKKIMEFEEFSNEALNTVNQAHNQAVFIYKMLCEKQEEMKSFIPEIDKQFSAYKNDYKTDMIEKTEPANEKNGGGVEKNFDEARKSRPAKTNKSKNNSRNKRNNRSGEKGTNRNDKILELYDKGISIIDISKQLDIGQGEVNLVVELYRGNK